MPDEPAKTSEPTEGKGRSLDPVRLIDLYRLDLQKDVDESLSAQDIEQHLESPEARRRDINQTRLIDLYRLSPGDVSQPDDTAPAADAIAKQIGVPEPVEQPVDPTHPAVRGGDLYRLEPARNPDQTLPPGEIEKLVTGDQKPPEPEPPTVRGGDLYRLPPAADPDKTIRVDDLERLISGEQVTIDLHDLPQPSAEERTGTLENLGLSHAPLAEGVPGDDFLTEEPAPDSSTPVSSALESYRPPEKPILKIDEDHVRQTPIASDEPAGQVSQVPEVLETISSDDIDFIHGDGKTPSLSREMSNRTQPTGRPAKKSGAGKSKAAKKKSKKKSPRKKKSGPKKSKKSPRKPK